MGSLAQCGPAGQCYRNGSDVSVVLKPSCDQRIAQAFLMPASILSSSEHMLIQILQ